jgi:dTDP-4-dehydrorhamnose 3,5-epimerase
MQCEIEGVVIRELRKFTDSRGWLMELFRHDELDEDYCPVMAYVSMTLPGVARGPHEHADQADQFAFIGPSTFRLYLWDNRKDSTTFGLSARLDVGENNPTAVIVPKGVVHAYKNIGDREGIVYNAPNRLYGGRGRNEPIDEIRHEVDPNCPFRLDD